MNKKNIIDLHMTYNYDRIFILNTLIWLYLLSYAFKTQRLTVSEIHAAHDKRALFKQIIKILITK